MDAWRIGADDTDFGSRVVADAEGNIYVLGHFRDSIDVGRGTAASVLTSAGNSDGFLCKYSPSGNLLWGISLSGPDAIAGGGLAVDENGNAYVIGLLSGTADFDPGPDAFMLTATESTQAFLWKLNSEGQLVWAQIIGQGVLGAAFDVVIDASDNIFVGGFFSGSGDFDAGANVQILESQGPVDAFVCALDPTGGLQWAVSLGGEDFDSAVALAADGEGGVYVAGLFEATADFDPGDGEALLQSVGAKDVFVCRLNSSGSLSWAASTGGVDEDEVVDLALVGNDVYVVGSLFETSDFDPGAGVSNLVSAGGRDGFVWKLSDSGEFRWGRSVGGLGSDRSFSVAASSSGAIIVAGMFQNSVDFDPGSNGFVGTSVGSTNSFLWKLDSDGSFLDADILGGAGDVSVQNIYTDNDFVYVIGVFTDTVDVDPSSSQQYLTSSGGLDTFVATFRQTDGPAAGGGEGEGEGEGEGGGCVLTSSSAEIRLADVLLVGLTLMALFASGGAIGRRERGDG